ncbi:MAG: PIG-L deacetylase family protein [Chloroflexota bacterium]
MRKSILLVFAHPDDESFGVAGTAAKYSRKGIPVDLICATKGEIGMRLNVPENIDTGTAREAELRAAAKIVGIRDIYFLGYIDGKLNKVSDGRVTNKIFRLMKTLQPGVVITFGPDGITGHPDHIAIGMAATAAFQKLVAADKEAGKLYYVTIPESSAEVNDFSGITTRPDSEVTTEIDIGNFINIKIKAIAAHRSQQDSADFIEFLKSGESDFTRKEFFYLKSGKTAGKKSDLFQ